MFLTYGNTEQGGVDIGDEAEVYIDGTIEFVTVTDVQDDGNWIETKNDHGNVFTFYNYEAFKDAIGDV